MSQEPASENVDPQQENRRLRARMATMRSRQALARGGVVAAGLLVLAAHKLGNLAAETGADSDTHVLMIAAIVVGTVIVILTALPFLRSDCPKCKGRYHSPASLFQPADDPPPCKRCGFQINRHVSRYS